MLTVVVCWFVLGAGRLWSVHGLVLDPALYLAPSPPLSPSGAGEPPRWWSPRAQRDTLHVIPIQLIKIPEKLATTSETTQVPLSTTAQLAPSPTTTPQSTKMTTEEETMEQSETFWPVARSTATTAYLGIRGIHVPLTFSLTGNYGLGRYGAGAGNIGVIGSSYASVDTGDSGLFKLYGKSALAGSSYGSYGGYAGTRIYGSEPGAAWGGWGNGKWGHYGKG